LEWSVDLTFNNYLKADSMSLIICDGSNIELSNGDKWKKTEPVVSY
jgi:hypothetical protein